jgi:hypothetical protein
MKLSKRINFAPQNIEVESSIGHSIGLSSYPCTISPISCELDYDIDIIDSDKGIDCIIVIPLLIKFNVSVKFSYEDLEKEDIPKLKNLGNENVEIVNNSDDSISLLISHTIWADNIEFDEKNICSNGGHLKFNHVEISFCHKYGLGAKIKNKY